MQRVSSWTRRRCGRLPGRAPSGCCCFSGQLLSVPVLRDECAAFVSSSLRPGAPPGPPPSLPPAALSRCTCAAAGPDAEAQQQESTAAAAAAMVLSQEVSVSLSIIALVSLIGAGVGVGSGIGALARCLLGRRVLEQTLQATLQRRVLHC